MGTNESGYVESDYESENFLTPWPGTHGKLFALNSNYEMNPKRNQILQYRAPLRRSSRVNGCSYFSKLYNDAFRIVGFNTAYFDPDQSSTGFMIGSIGPTGLAHRLSFSTSKRKSAAAAKQQLILPTHHNGLPYNGSGTSPLWDQVIAASWPRLSGSTVIWYWGHEHMGVVYTDRAAASNITIRPRCCGHSCIPWGVATALNTSGVDWY